MRFELLIVRRKVPIDFIRYGGEDVLPLGCIATELPVEPHSPMLSVAIARILVTGFLAYLSEFTCAFLNCFGVSNFSKRNTTPKLNLVPPVHLHCGVMNSHDDID